MRAPFTGTTVIAAYLAAGASVGQAAALGTAFSYQGQVKINGTPASGLCDFEFALFDALAGGNQIGLTLTHLAVPVSSGLFTTTLDFGSSPFAGDARWLQTSVRWPAGAGNYVVLPRQAITADAYALYAVTAGALRLPFAGSGSNANVIFEVTNTGASSSSHAIRGISTTGIGVVGVSNGTWGGYFDGGPGDKGLYVDGKVGINESNPTEAVHVIGNVRATGLKVSDGLFSSSQGGSLELGQQTGGAATPFIDFHHGDASDFNVRLINNPSGQLGCTGIFNAPIKNFLIDHPVDPANKTLTHSCVESSRYLNLYTGRVQLDKLGEAWITLPAWFAALNTEPEYILTPIGAAMPNLHVADELRGNQFRIAGGAPGKQVSWQVTGVRQDAFSQAHPLQVESQKRPEEQGRYLHPIEYGQPESLRIGPREETQD